MPSSSTPATCARSAPSTQCELVPGTTHLKRLLPAITPAPTVDTHTYHDARPASALPSSRDLATIAATVLGPVLAVIDAHSSPEILRPPRYTVQVRAHASMLRRGTLNAAHRATANGSPVPGSGRHTRIAGVRIMRTPDPSRFDFIARTTLPFGPDGRHQFLAGAIGRSDAQLARTPWILHAVRAL